VHVVGVLNITTFNLPLDPSLRDLFFGAGLGVASESGGETGTCTFVVFGER
jgi:hypothetical protein